MTNKTIIKNLILLILVLTITLQGATATPASDLYPHALSYWQMNDADPQLDLKAVKNMTHFSLTSGTGIFDEGRVTNAETDGYIATDSTYGRLTNSLDFSVNLWLTTTDLVGGNIIGQWTGSNNVRWTLQYDVGNAGDGDLGIYWCNGWLSGSPELTGTGVQGRQMFTIIWNEANNNVTLYRNGTSIISDTGRTCGSQSITHIGGLKDGFPTGLGGFGGTLDEITYWDITLSNNNITNLWNSGAGLELSAGGGGGGGSGDLSLSAIVFNNTSPFISEDLFANTTYTITNTTTLATITGTLYLDNVWTRNQTWTSVSNNTVLTFYMDESNFTSSGQVINVTFFASAGTNTTKTSATVTAYNTLPTISSVRLFSNTNTTIEPLQGFATGQDADNNSVDFEYNLYQNGVRVYEFNLSFTQEQIIPDQFWQNGKWRTLADFNYTKLIDGNFATGSTGENSGAENISIARLNYTKISGADRIKTVWFVQFNQPGGTKRQFNLTLTGDCWDFQANKLSIEYTVFKDHPKYYSEFYCLKSGGKDLLRNETATQDIRYIMEDKIVFFSNVSKNPGTEYALANFSSLLKGGNYTLEVRSYDGTNFSAWSNSSQVTIKFTPTLSNVYPVNATSYNFNLSSGFNYLGYINFTTNITSLVSINDSRWTLNFSNGTFHSFYNSGYASLPDGLLTVRINALHNASKGNTTLFLSFTIDTNPPNQVNDLSGKIGLDSMTFQINYSDDVQLWSVNVSGLDYAFYLESINTTTYQLNGTLNLVNHTVGSHDLYSEVCDGHTSLEIKNFRTIKSFGTKKIEFGFDEDEFVSVRPKFSLIFTSFDTEKSQDRYSFEFIKPEDKRSTEEVFIVKSSHRIEIVRNNKYTGWLVIPALKKWIDFENTEGYSATIKRVDDYTVEVTSAGQHFNSIGSLNCYSTNITYYNILYNVTYDLNVAEGSNEQYIVRINRTNVPITSRSGWLTYNLTDTVNLTNYTMRTNFLNLTFERTTNYLTSDNGTFTFFFNFTLNGYEFNTSIFSQIVFNFGLSNCSAGDLNIIYNVSIFNEQDLNPLVSNLKGTFYFWGANSSIQNNITINLDGESTYYICSLNNLSTTLDVYLQNIVSYTHRYYLYDNLVTPGVPNYADLYNFNSTTGISQLKGVTRLETNFQYFENIVGSMQRFYPELNIWKTVQMDKSGDFGLLSYDIIEKSTDYRFIFKDTNNSVLKSTNSLKFVCSSGTCELTFLMNPSSGTSISGTLNVNAIFNNVTGFVNVSWSDPEGDTRTVITNISKETLGGSLQICGFTQTGSAGSNSCNITGYEGKIMVRVRTRNSPLFSHYMQIFINQATWITDYISKIDSTLITGAIVVISILSSLFSPVGGVIGTLIGLIMIFMLGLFTPFTFTFIMVACAMGVTLGLIIKK